VETAATAAAGIVMVAAAVVGVVVAAVVDVVATVVDTGAATGADVADTVITPMVGARRLLACRLL
jgi:hypothetical protein